MKATASSAATGGWRLKAVLMAAMAAGLFGVLLLAQGQAQAHDHQIPDTLLMKGTQELQAGTRVKESSWDRRVGEDLCENRNVFYSTRFPETDTVAAGSELRVRVSKAQRPDSFSIGAYRAVDEQGAPTGEARMLKRSLERVVRDGETVAWEAVFSVKRPSRDYYLIAEGHWQDEGGCGAEQFASWSFHVKTRV
jgi:hypothetical protein